MRILAGFDLGTTGCRCVLFDEHLDLLGEGYHEYPLLTGENGVAEQDAELWWTLLIRALHDAAAMAGRDPSEVSALSLSSQGITVVPVDREFRPLANAINWLDRRGDTGFEAIFDALGAQRYRQIAARLSPEDYGLPKVMWLRRHRPELLAETHQYLMPMDFIIARLCGHAVTDHSMAAGMACYDMNARAWSEEILAAAGVPASMLPEIRNSGSVAGYVTEDAARRSGLRAGIPVAVGAQDQKCGALGAGLSRDTATVSLGTCMAVLIKSDRVVCDERDYLPCFSDLFQDGYLLEGCVNVGAGCLKWYRDLYYPDWSYAQVAALAGAHAPTGESPMFFPHLSGMSTPHRWPNGTGAFYGLQLNTTREGMAHAVLEAVAFSLRQNLEAARRTAGSDIRRLRAFGGGAKSPEWLQLIADATGLPVERLQTHEICCVGAAMLAGLASGTFDGVRSAGAQAAQVRERFSPNPRLRPVYDARYRLYEEREARIFRGAGDE